MSKKTVYIFLTIGGIVGGYLGGLLDGGSMFGLWGILGSTLGGILGIYIAYKIQM